MSTTSAPLTDSRIMLRRNFKHILRNPVTIFNGALMPVVLMLLFVYVFGNAFNVGEHYIEYATPGLILLAISYGLSATAVSVNSDMTKGIINRFKVMNVSRGAVLNGHVVATMLSSSVAIAVIIGMAFALGFRSPATPLDWLGAIGIIVAAAFAAAWLTVALGMAAKTPESAGLTVVPLILLPFLSSAIVPAAKMGQGVRQFAEYQPFTPIIESLRGLLAGTPSGGYAAAALAWCAGIALAGYLWSLATFTGARTSRLSRPISRSSTRQEENCHACIRHARAHRRHCCCRRCSGAGHRERPDRHRGAGRTHRPGEPEGRQGGQQDQG